MSDRYIASDLATCDAHEGAPEDDGLQLRNCGYAILLIASYVMLALLIGRALSG